MTNDNRPGNLAARRLRREKLGGDNWATPGDQTVRQVVFAVTAATCLGALLAIGLAGAVGCDPVAR